MSRDPQYEDVLRRALHAAADGIEPAGDGLERIRARLTAPRPLPVVWLVTGYAAAASTVLSWLQVLTDRARITSGPAARPGMAAPAQAPGSSRSQRQIRLAMPAWLRSGGAPGPGGHSWLRPAIAAGVAACVLAAGAMVMVGGVRDPGGFLSVLTGDSGHAGGSSLAGQSSGKIGTGGGSGGSPGGGGPVRPGQPGYASGACPPLVARPPVGGASPGPSVSTSPSATPTPAASSTPSTSASPSPTPTTSGSPSPTPTPTPTPTTSASPSPSATTSPASGTTSDSPASGTTSGSPGPGQGITSGSPGSGPASGSPAPGSTSGVTARPAASGSAVRLTGPAELLSFVVVRAPRAAGSLPVAASSPCPLSGAGDMWFSRLDAVPAGSGPARTSQQLQSGPATKAAGKRRAD
jgi:hypothetical protein